MKLGFKPAIMIFIPNHENNGEGANIRDFVKRHKKHVLAELNYKPGNHADFTLVFKVFYKQLCYFSNRLVKDWSCAEDTVVDVFIKFWNQRGDFKGIGPIKRWLYKCTYNDSLRHIKAVKNKSTSNIESIYTYASDANNKLTEMITNEQLAEIRILIETLPQQCRNIIKLYYFLELDNTQIALMFNISVYTVKNQKARGIYLLRKRMSQLVPS